MAEEIEGVASVTFARVSDDSKIDESAFPTAVTDITEYVSSEDKDSEFGMPEFMNGLFELKEGKVPEAEPEVVGSTVISSPCGRAAAVGLATAFRMCKATNTHVHIER